MNQTDQIARHEAYTRILADGLLSIRRAAFSGNDEICAIEADHLHNVASLLNETNVSRHRYYITIEQPDYMIQLKALENGAYIGIYDVPSRTVADARNNNGQVS